MEKNPIQNKRKTGVIKGLNFGFSQVVLVEQGMCWLFK
jgi:hypothetical protein